MLSEKDFQATVGTHVICCFLHDLEINRLINGGTLYAHLKKTIPNNDIFRSMQKTKDDPDINQAVEIGIPFFKKIKNMINDNNVIINDELNNNIVEYNSHVINDIINKVPNSSRNMHDIYQLLIKIADLIVSNLSDIVHSNDACYILKSRIEISEYGNCIYIRKMLSTTDEYLQYLRKKRDRSFEDEMCNKINDWIKDKLVSEIFEGYYRDIFLVNMRIKKHSYIWHEIEIDKSVQIPWDFNVEGKYDLLLKRITDEYMETLKKNIVQHAQELIGLPIGMKINIGKCVPFKLKKIEVSLMIYIIEQEQSSLGICPETKQLVIHDKNIISAVMDKLKIMRNMKTHFSDLHDIDNDGFSCKHMNDICKEKAYDVFSYKRFYHIHYLYFDKKNRTKYILFCTEILNANNIYVQVYCLHVEKLGKDWMFHTSFYECIDHFFSSNESHKDRYILFQKFLDSKPSETQLNEIIRPFI